MDKDSQAIQNKMQNEVKLYKATQKGENRAGRVVRAKRSQPKDMQLRDNIIDPVV